MNAERRKKIDEIIATLESVKGDIEDVASEERDYHDNMPENMQSGDKGSAAEEAASALEEAANSVYDIVSNLEQARGG